MFDRFLINQRIWILLLTLMLFLSHAVAHASHQASAWVHGIVILVGLGFTLYNALFITNWHHLCERLVNKIQKWRSRRLLTALPRKKVWYQQKLISFIGLVIGLLVSLVAFLGLVMQTSA
ncbi:hypothetical protein IQ266_03795 [filamentous cyanobacterium LEGE 11480]|uniref:DUF3899 domain-containing protein n=1 Tax=Romeriopsis navalis LEGE 11480 TaxID=2777977 RepID=A0A928VJH7_9CYAN|nr:hypothetical protein [Romeriopsis navalis]MBE9028883.1 hypothetical protein [Romeriopsis navalis LEGE 11480]